MNSRRQSIRTYLAGEGPLFALLVLFGLNAVDELDRSAFAILVPNISDHFGISHGAILGLVAGITAGALVLQIPVAQYADRGNRIMIAAAGALAWACFSFMTGLATSLLLIGIARVGSGIGKAVNDPTHNTLIADWFEPKDRARAYAVHRSANVFGATIGPLLAGLLASFWGWRTPFFLFAIPTLALVALTTRLREPVRGAHERRLAGANEEIVNTPEEPATYGEALRTIWHIRSMRRLFTALPFVGASLLGFLVLATLLYEEEFGMDERARGFAGAIAEPFTFAGLAICAVVLPKLFRRGATSVLRFAAGASAAKALLAVGFAMAPNKFFAVGFAALINFSDGVVGPALLFVFSLAIPPRSRAIGFSMSSLFILPGLLLLPVIGGLADAFGIRAGMLLLTPIFLVGSGMLFSTAPLIPDDIANVWRSTTARSAALARRRHDDAPLLTCSGIEVYYDGVQVLFGTDIEAIDGSIVALLGTNGAGKSTLLRSIAGTTVNQRGAIIFDGVDITYAGAEAIASKGVVMLPGGAAVFPHLSVAENLRTASWLHADDPELKARQEAALDLFPVLRDRMDDPAGTLSGGQQQMVALAMVMLARPRLLLLDELSLGLAPLVVEDLVEAVKAINAAGVTVIIVDQSVHLALQLADTAYFLERGRVEFHGPTAELLERPDLLRAVFLDQAVQVSPDGQDEAPAARDDNRSQSVEARLSVCGLTKSFGGNRAVDGVDIEFNHGIVGIIGPNGAGKTTLLNLMSGTLIGDQGKILFDGTDITRTSPATRARAGLTRSFQHSRLFPELTVEETLAVALDRWNESRNLGSQILAMPGYVTSEHQTTMRTGDLIELFGLGPFRGRLIRELSTGTRRVVDLACAMAHRPRVLLLDEPSAGIAQGEAEALPEALVQMHTVLDTTLVVVEHDLDILGAMCHSVIAMDEGRMIAHGTMDEVLSEPEVIAAYLGADPLAGEAEEPGIK